MKLHLLGRASHMRSHRSPPSESPPRLERTCEDDKHSELVAMVQKPHSLARVFEVYYASKALEQFAGSIHAAENVQAIIAIDMFNRKSFQELTNFLRRVVLESLSNRIDDEMTIFSSTSSLQTPSTTKHSNFNDEKRTAQQIYDTFFRPEAPCWACLEATVLTFLLDALNTESDLPGNLFKPARDQCFQSIKTEIYPKFVHFVSTSAF